ncbi:MAG: PEGA domain-containing protein [Myxococcaceae bacterium]|nr:PEGA domain-containing protein [Myxococcaceae bacterium]
MGEPHKGAPSPDVTLVDPDDAGPTPHEPVPAIPVGKRPTSADLPIANDPTGPITNAPTTPGKRATRSGLPAQRSPETEPVLPWVDPPADPPPQERKRVTGKRAPSAELLEAPTSLTPMAQSKPPASKPPQPNVGPSGTLDTDVNPMGDAAEVTLTGEEPPPPARDLRLDSLTPGGPDSTHDYKPLTPTKRFVGLDEAQFRRAIWGLALGGLALVCLTFVWVMVKYDDAPLDPGAASKIEPPPGTPQPQKAAPAPLVAEVRPVMIEQTVDAGAGTTKTVLAEAGTIRIVSDPEANASVDGRQLGVTPVLVTLPAGKNLVQLENVKLGFKRTVTVDVISNEQTAVRFAFSKGWLELDAPANAKVLVDGRPAGGKQVQVWEGAHKVEALFDDKKKTHTVRTAEVSAGMTTSVHFDAPSIADDD